MLVHRPWHGSISGSAFYVGPEYRKEQELYIKFLVGRAGEVKKGGGVEGGGAADDKYHMSSFALQISPK